MQHGAATSYRIFALLAMATLTVVALGWFVARDFQQSAEAAHELYERFDEGLDLIDDILFETEEVRRILLYALHTSDANRQLDYVEQSRAAEARVNRLLENRSTILSTEGTRAARESVAAAWTTYLETRDEVVGLILEGSLRDGVALDEALGNARFNRVRSAIAELKASFKADAAKQVEAERARSSRATTRLGVIVVSALLLVAIGVYLVHRRSSLEAVLRSEAHKGSILQAVPDPIISTDASGRIIELNHAAEQVFGLRRSTALGRRLHEAILPPTEWAALLPIFGESPASLLAPAPRLQLTGQRGDGSPFPIEVAANAHTVGRDRIWTLHISDLTDRFEVEEHLRRAKQAAEAAARIKTDFLTTMSHEVRTPLTGVIGITDLLQNADIPGAQRELVRMLRTNAATLLALVNNVLDYSQIEAGLMPLAPRPFSVQALVEDALDSVSEPASRKGLALGYVIDADVPDLKADEDRVRQVLLNLLSNAVKHTETGEIAIDVAAAMERPDMVAVTIRVRDTGVGIPQELQQRLFQWFSQIQPAGDHRVRGTGLGLAISDRLSRLLGGSMSVESRYGAGSTFTFAFRAEPVGINPSSAVEGAQLRGARVLAMLGPGIVREQIRSLLQRWNVQAAFHDGEHVPAGEYDVVIVDGNATGSAFYDALLKNGAEWRLQRVPLIVIAGLRYDGERPGRVGEHIVATPVRTGALHAALCAAIGRTVADNDAPTGTHALFNARHMAILLVEDNEPNRRVVHLMLRELGLDADEAAGGHEAINRAAQRRYDIILMDVQMPDLDGLEATRRIRALEHNHRATIVALTANVFESDETRCREAGMDGYLQKPMSLDMLAAALSAGAPTPP
jgi:PAS domain S-box-containing protein